MIAIIDYGAGNMHSIEKALEYVGAQAAVTDDPAVVAAAHAVVLPGVGSGGTAMARMIERGLDDAIRQATQQVKPLREGLPIFAGLPQDAYFYFAHSYYVEPQDQHGVAAITDYGAPFCSVIVDEHIWGTQFHPEKSGNVGLHLLSNFVKWGRGWKR